MKLKLTTLLTIYFLYRLSERLQLKQKRYGRIIRIQGTLQIFTLQLPHGAIKAKSHHENRTKI